MPSSIYYDDVSGFEAAITSNGDPWLGKFVGYREGMTDTDPGTFVEGSDHGWRLAGTHGNFQIYVRRRQFKGLARF